MKSLVAKDPTSLEVGWPSAIAFVPGPGTDVGAAGESRFGDPQTPKNSLDMKPVFRIN